MRLRLRCLSCISSSSSAYCSTSILERCDLCGEVLGFVCFFPSSSGLSFWKQRRRHRRDNFLTFCAFLATEISESAKIQPLEKLEKQLLRALFPDADKPQWKIGYCSFEDFELDCNLLGRPLLKVKFWILEAPSLHSCFCSRKLTQTV